MRIVLATPLYPPEIAEPAPYMKELAKRLARLHEVTVVAYARLPEKVPGVSVVVVDKRRPLPLRLLSYVRTLRNAMRRADVVYAENGASVELPVGLLSLVDKRPLILHLGDHTAHERAQAHVLLRAIERFVFSRAAKIMTDIPLSKPEIMPLEPFPAEKLAAYEQSWDAHLRILEDAFNHAIA